LLNYTGLKPGVIYRKPRSGFGFDPKYANA
jgi:hypothetical protein